jgi:hypothetical protein
VENWTHKCLLWAISRQNFHVVTLGWNTLDRNLAMITVISSVKTALDLTLNRSVIITSLSPSGGSWKKVSSFLFYRWRGWAFFTIFLAFPEQLPYPPTSWPKQQPNSSDTLLATDMAATLLGWVHPILPLEV